MKRTNLLARTTVLSAAILATVSAIGNTNATEPRESAQEAQSPVQQAWQDTKRETSEARYEASSATQNAWLHGRLEAALLLNRHLNNFRIDSRVDDGVAYLDGTVESEIDAELAEQIALSIDGIDRVENDLTVDPAMTEDETAGAGERTFSQRIEDATTTASVKTTLLMNDQTEGLKINVDTTNEVVTLRGSVRSDEERQLAEKLAANTEDVKSVVNELQVSKVDAS